MNARRRSPIEALIYWADVALITYARSVDDATNIECILRFREIAARMIEDAEFAILTYPASKKERKAIQLLNLRLNLDNTTAGIAEHYRRATVKFA